MTVQTGGGSIVITPGDCKFTHRGQNIALKIRVLSWPAFVICAKLVDAEDDQWQTKWLINEWYMDGGDTPENMLEKFGGIDNYMTQHVIPTVNTWLANEFPPDGAGPRNALEEIDAALKKVVWVVAPDNTLSIRYQPS